ncbi:hypothetical protein BDZ94DRAFT_90770 [Collybia nuda]|uniref:Uncharacterized protein n=1 Tax=Collybia nuda TaxID=64659 RepID=A0A9P5YE01_9AGAR|nr:hypothetical protein BDZ94DRAFT_90770 [Collybia nuda]
MPCFRGFREVRHENSCIQRPTSKLTASGFYIKNRSSPIIISIIWAWPILGCLAESPPPSLIFLIRKSLNCRIEILEYPFGPTHYVFRP